MQSGTLQIVNGIPCRQGYGPEADELTIHDRLNFASPNVISLINTKVYVDDEKCMGIYM